MSNPTRPLRVAFLVATLAVWWLGYRSLVPWVQRVAGFERVTDPTAMTLLGHWVFWQLPAVLVGVALWVLGARFGLMPTLPSTLTRGTSWRTTLVSGAVAGACLLVATAALVVAFNGSFGVHPPWVKMVGDAVSNLYEELFFRGLVLCAFYGAFAGRTFEVFGSPVTRGVVAAVVGSNIVFAAGHGQYPLPVQVVGAILSTAFAWPWLKARSLWAPYVAHMLADVVGDSFMKL